MAVAAQAPSVTAGFYEEYVNPQWVRLLDVLRMNVKYTRCRGTRLETDDGRTILDFNSGYCVHNIGHNHPQVVAALKQELDIAGPAMLQNHVADLAGLLKLMCLDGKGIAWLPRGLVTADLAAGRLEVTGSPEWHIPLEIRLFRNRRADNPSTELFWDAITRR